MVLSQCSSSLYIFHVFKGIVEVMAEKSEMAIFFFFAWQGQWGSCGNTSMFKMLAKISKGLHKMSNSVGFL